MGAAFPQDAAGLFGWVRARSLGGRGPRRGRLAACTFFLCIVNFARALCVVNTGRDRVKNGRWPAAAVIVAHERPGLRGDPRGWGGRPLFGPSAPAGSTNLAVIEATLKRPCNARLCGPSNQKAIRCSSMGSTMIAALCAPHALSDRDRLMDWGCRWMLEILILLGGRAHHGWGASQLPLVQLG